MKNTGEIETIKDKPIDKEGLVNNDKSTEQIAPVTFQSQENKASEADNSAETPEQFSKLQRWFNILRQVCQEEPRVVLKALQNPEKLMKQAPENVTAKRAESLRWNTLDQEKARKQFGEKGVDSDKAIGVINFLRENVTNYKYPLDKNGYIDFDNKVLVSYQYQAENDFRAISELSEICDDPVSLMKDLKNVITYEFLDSADFDKLVEYCRLVINTPKARETIKKIGALKNPIKLGLGYNVNFYQDEKGEKKVFYGSNLETSTDDPIQTLANLDDKLLQELLTEENLAKAQELWEEITDGEELRTQYIPPLLKLAHNPTLKKAFLNVSKNFSGFKDFKDEIFGWKTYKFNLAVGRIEKIFEEMPEVAELLEEGFNLDELFNFRNVLENRDTASNIKGHLVNRGKFLLVHGDQQIRENAKILQKYGLRMPISSDRCNDEFLLLARTADSDRLEKILLIDDLVGDLVNRPSYRDRNRSSVKIKIWRIVGEKLDSFSVEQVAELFQLLADQKEEFKNLHLDLDSLINDFDSLDSFRKRIESILRPEIRAIVQDYAFVKKVLDNNHSNQEWMVLLKQPDAYLALYEQKDLLLSRLNTIDDCRIAWDLDLAFFNGLLNLSNEDFELFISDITLSPLRFGLKEQSLAKFHFLKNIDRNQKAEAIGLMPINNFYSEAFDLKELKSFFSLNESDQNKVLELIKNNNFNFLFTKDANSHFHLQFFCELVKNDDYFISFYNYAKQFLSTKNEIDLDQFAQLDKKLINSYSDTEIILYFRQLIEAHADEADFKIEEYINQEGLVTNKFLYEMAMAEGEEPRDNLLYLITNEALAEMSSEDRNFWSFWKDRPVYLKKFLIENREDFKQLVIDGQASYQLSAQIAYEDAENFLEDAELSDLSRFSSSEKREIKVKLVGGLIKTGRFPEFFSKIHSILSQDLAENGHLSKDFKELPESIFGFDLFSEDFVRKLDKFYLEAHDERYVALITDPESFWKKNAWLLAKIESIPWEINDFDRFRSLIFNAGTNAVLSSTSKPELTILSEKIALKPENLFNVSKDSINWLVQNLHSPQRSNFFKQILNQKPSSFNSCVATFRRMKSEQIDMLIESDEYSRKLFDAMTEFGNITPSLISAYILNPSEKAREEYREKINLFKDKVHKNEPIKPLIEGIGGLDFLADMIAMTFSGTNFEQIKRDLVVLEDRCDDVADLKIREDGYQGEIVSKEKIAELKDERKPIDDGVINLIKVIFADQQEQDYLNQGGDASLAFQGWARLLVEAGATNQQVLFKDNLSEVIACSRVSLGDKIAMFAEKIAGDTSQVSAKNDVLSKARELFGIYYKDNASEAITMFLEQHQEQVITLLGRLSDKRLNALEKNIANSKSISEESRTTFKTIIEGLRNKELAEAERTKLLAQLLAFMTERSIFAGPVGLRKKVSKESDKIILKDQEGREVDPDLIMTGYLTKNAASYFAKETAGVCTSGDKELFNRPDHFHVNLVDKDGNIVGNIQAYRLDYEGRPALIFRGFNPSTSIVSTTNAEVLCDQMLDMVKQIAADNNIDQIFIPQQDNWHPLTNRVGEGVDKYFASRFYRSENKVEFPFDITGGKTVNTFYRIT